MIAPVITVVMYSPRFSNVLLMSFIATNFPVIILQIPIGANLKIVENRLSLDVEKNSNVISYTAEMNERNVTSLYCM